MIQPYYENRELSWLRFNMRVLEEASSESVPLLERLGFSAIYQSNMDEFVMVRVGTMIDRWREKPKSKDSRSGMTPKKQVHAMLDEIAAQLPHKDNAYAHTMAQLRAYGYEHVRYEDTTQEEKHFLDLYFKRELKPLLSPVIVDKSHPFPFLRNKEIYVAVHLQSKSKVKIGFIPTTGFKERIIRLNRSGRFILVEDLLLHFAPLAFKYYTVLDSALLRVTRNADIRYDSSAQDEDTDFREVMQGLLQKRKKREAVRLQMSRSLEPQAMEYLLKKLHLSRRYLFFEETPLDLSFVFKLGDFNSDPILRFAPHKPQVRKDISGRRNMLDQVLERDILLSYPYESISPFLRLLHDAANDPDVASIKITLYRLATNSQVIESLIQAAENGKEVLVMVELRARFDEENNIQWASMLQEAGCTIMYGPHNMKVHSKLLLITMHTEEGVKHVVQVGTGNYNEKTSKIYTDLCLMTANPLIGEDARHVFDTLAMDTLVQETDALLVAPLCLKSKILAMIDEEITLAKEGKRAYFAAKVNSISDVDLMDKLSEASSAGVKVDLIVRGICCLKPGIKGSTENIRIVSIVGRYLEHSRVYIFGTGERQRVYISSADFMTRNTVHRVEVAAPILDDALKKQVVDMVDLCLRDTLKAREGQPDGTFRLPTLKEDDPLINAQEELFKKTLQ